ncbi:MAG: hydroxymethylglutaryl-CoA synthase [Methanobacteriota archaeon]|nr:MAG: hydroxymethylglutaryl-CoA synthase [Euryarchaeota archaeon]
MAVGISGYGVAVPRLRVKKEEYAKAWGSFRAAGVKEKAVMGFDEDVLTMAAKVSRRALSSVPISADRITRFAFASTSAPYGEKLLSGTIITNIGAPSDAFVSDHTTSSRAGTEAVIAGMEHLRSNPEGCTVVSAADAPKASMWKSIEHGLGAGAAGFVLSKENLIAEIEGHASFACEHFGERFKSNSEDLIQDLEVRKFAQSSFVGATTKAATNLMTSLKSKPDDYAHIVIQQPDARMPATIAKKLGFDPEKLVKGSVVSEMGDIGAASTLVGLAAALDSAQMGEKILVVSYGSGAASDAISLKVVGERRASPSVRTEIERKEYIDYIQYLKLKGAIR